MADSQIAVNAHRCQNERRAGQRHYLNVENKLTQHRAKDPRLERDGPHPASAEHEVRVEDPRLVKRDEQNLRQQHQNLNNNAGRRIRQKRRRKT